MSTEPRGSTPGTCLPSRPRRPGPTTSWAWRTTAGTGTGGLERLARLAPRNSRASSTLGSGSSSARSRMVGSPPIESARIAGSASPTCRPGLPPVASLRLADDSPDARRQPGR